MPIFDSSRVSYLGTALRDWKGSESPESECTSFQLAASIATIVCLIGLLSSSGCEQSKNVELTDRSVRLSAIPSTDRAGLTFSVAKIDLGIVPPGHESEEIAVLANETPNPLTLARVRTSCDCLEVTCETGEIEPSQRIPVLFRYRPSSDDKFVGSLSITVEALDLTGNEIALTEVQITVDPLANRIVLNDGPGAPAKIQLGRRRIDLHYLSGAGAVSLE